jgi:phosphoribosylformimino-5-aminoimidazole carboxamide ribotide isomerase
MFMEIIPVQDIMGGKAVSGRSGNRTEYRPLGTIFTDSSDPVDIAWSMPYPRLYVADLDGIMKGAPDLHRLQKLAGIKALMVDMGIKGVDDISWFKGLDAEIVLGTETLEGPKVLERAMDEFGERVIVSIDIKEGHVLSRFLPPEPFAALDHLTQLGAKRFIFLDMTSVGTLGFGSLEPLLEYANSKYPEIEMIVGGGIKKEDLEKLEKMGVDGALVGTALHKGLL